jgi:hypothetical protein
MTNRFLMSVAAVALIAGTGLANAQGTGMGREAPSAGSAQQSAPSSDRGAPSAATPMNRNDAAETKGAETKGSDSGMKSTQSNEKMAPGGSTGQRAQDTAPGQKSKTLSSETNDSSKAGTKAEGRSAADSKGGAADKNMNAQTKSATDNKNMNADSKSTTDNKTGTTADTKSGSTNSQTTGNAATSATAAPPAEKRTQITSAIKSEHVEEVTNVNFNVSIGTAVPASVRFHPLPSRIVEIYPEWRGYEFILVRGKYVIIRPQTREIVYVIEG